MSYEDYRKSQIHDGLLFQDFVVDTLASTIGLIVQQYASRAYQIGVGESRQGVEIKHDKKYASTGNLWIEMAEKARPRPGDYARSGIHRDDNTWLYVIGDYDTIFVFPKTILVALGACGRYRHLENGTETSVGFLLPSADALRYAAVVLRPNAAVKVARHVKEIEQFAKQLHADLLRDERQRGLFGGESAQ